MKETITKEILNNTIKLIKYKTIKNEYKEFDKAYDFIKKELKNYNIKEHIINNYKNLVISKTQENNLDIIFCAHLDVVPANTYNPRSLRW